MMTIISLLQLHNLQHKIGFLFIVFERKEPLKIYFTANHHKSTSPCSCNFIYGQLFKKGNSVSAIFSSPSDLNNECKNFADNLLRFILWESE